MVRSSVWALAVPCGLASWVPAVPMVPTMRRVSMVRLGSSGADGRRCRWSVLGLGVPMVGRVLAVPMRRVSMVRLGADGQV